MNKTFGILLKIVFVYICTDLLNVPFFVIAALCGMDIDSSASHILASLGSDSVNSLFVLSAELVSFGGILLCMYFVVRREGKSLKDIGFIKVRYFFVIGSGIILGFINVLAFLGIDTALGNHTSFLGYQNVNIALYYGVGAAVYWIDALSEELLFRAFIAVELLKILPKETAAFVSAIFFGLVHIFNPGYSIETIIILVASGYVWALMYYETRSIWVTTAFHFGYNFAIFALRIAPQDPATPFWSIQTPVSTAAYITVIFLIYFAWKRYLKKYVVVAEVSAVVN